MPRSKLIDYQRNYVFKSYVGTSHTFIGEVWCWIKAHFWAWRLAHMREGEIIDRYYELITKRKVMDLCQKNI